jgi:hypothetical protein
MLLKDFNLRILFTMAIILLNYNILFYLILNFSNNFKYKYFFLILSAISFSLFSICLFFLGLTYWITKRLNLIEI